jgi:hypothetical protein
MRLNGGCKKHATFAGRSTVKKFNENVQVPPVKDLLQGFKVEGKLNLRTTVKLI